jgi:hypothetical protein
VRAAKPDAFAGGDASGAGVLGAGTLLACAAGAAGRLALCGSGSAGCVLLGPCSVGARGCGAGEPQLVTASAQSQVRCFRNRRTRRGIISLYSDCEATAADTLAAQQRVRDSRGALVARTVDAAPEARHQVLRAIHSFT